MCCLAVTAKGETIHFMSHYIHKNRDNRLFRRHTALTSKRKAVYTGLLGSWVRLLTASCWWGRRTMGEILQTSASQVLRGALSLWLWSPSRTQAGALRRSGGQSSVPISIFELSYHVLFTLLWLFMRTCKWQRGVMKRLLNWELEAWLLVLVLPGTVLLREV